MSKKKLGQFFTNPIIAEFMVNLACDENTSYFLDPAVGMGVFTKIAQTVNNRMTLFGCEIDPNMAYKFRAENKYPISLFEHDYLTLQFDKKFNAIVCNPPYNKFQEIKDRNNLISLFTQRYNIKISGYSNICVYFLVKSMNELLPDGKCCYILPYEFLNTGYGERIKAYLLKSKMLSTIIKFNNNLRLFDEAITTSCIILLENKKHDEVHFVSIDDIDEIKNYKETHKFIKTKRHLYSKLQAKEKWLQYFEIIENNEQYKNLVKLNSFAKVMRGIATGGNNFFALNRSKINKHRLSEDVCLPCITKSSDIKGQFFTDEAFLSLVKDEKNMYIFNGCNAKTKEDFDYIKLGEQLCINERYLTSRRTPWYLIENKKPAPILVSVFNRDRIKVIRNEMMIKTLTTFHGIYLKNYSEETANIFFCYLLTPIAQEILYKNKREYGKGLDKFEPNDLNEAYILDLSIISLRDNEEILTIYNELRQGIKNTCIDRLNNIFASYLFNRFGGSTHT